jgi:hypothetical protein
LHFREGTQDGLGIEVPVLDGRTFQLDAELRPESCYFGPGSEAQAILGPAASSMKVLYIRRGNIEILDVPILR